MRSLNLCTVITVLFFSCATIKAQQYAQLVDTEIGSQGSGLGCGYNYIGASYPFGMVQFTPSFFSPQKGFVINQLSGAGCPHMGNVPVLPLNGTIEKSPDNMEGFKPYKTINEAHAGFLSVTMEDKTEAALTVNARSGIAKFKFNDDNDQGSVIIGSGISSTFTENAMIKITSNKTCEGFADGGEFCGTKTPYRIYFAIEFDREAKTKGTWIGNALLKESLHGYGKNSGAFFTFNTKDNSEVNYRIAISFVSVKNAKENLKASKLEGGFETYKNNAENVWNENLSKIAIETPNRDRSVQFYTHLYHALIHPNIVSDVNGEYMGADFQVYKTKGAAQYSSFSVWDTYRTQAQLLAMLYPKESSDMMQSLVDFADQSGGYGRWILANIETGIMQGDPTAILIANSYAFGATDFNLEDAYKHMKRGATIPLLRSQNQEIRPHLTEYIRDGHTFASMMLEYTSADFAIGQFALQALDNKADADFFIERSQYWKNIYNPKNNWLNSRYPNGKWKDIEHDWREATYKNYFWMVPYNLKGLIDTIGGNEVAEDRLDILFKRLDASYDEDWFAAGNEPDFQVPWIYNWTDEPYKTSEVIHRIFDEMYTSKPTGLPGNDDLGTMGAWYVYASMGLYPMIPGVAGFSINAPQFEKITLSLPDGKFTITGGSTNQHYIQSLKFNGKKQKTPWLDWKDIKSGGELDFKTAKKPNKNWAKNTISPSYN
ncbi:GH92 family glycosyl hydrolase [Winogradskyella bathintestinalis]|uniref:GH92 family glycosyl hydrolase n=1 Tax=Winogradskyella bathintestinalis TaxID=3035208 RepID=A0ABT7ZUQ5_9FLAO|nr:GH92 family glycosyl hydrolase [Winogradskyella bathintestinalis]MDN3492737.1 GH92 family glycosyl hydrolase [Winogradskyella bathintestinalis]